MKKWIRTHCELILYALFGVGTSALDWGIYAVSVDRVGIRWANALGWCGAVLFAFFTNKYFVFRTGGRGIRVLCSEFSEFIAVRLASLMIQTFGVEFLVQLGLRQRLLGITGGLAKAIITILVVIINYICSKFFIFRKKRKST